MPASMVRYDGKIILGARSTGSGAFAAYDWRDMLLGRSGGPIERKAGCPSRQLVSFAQSEKTVLKQVLGHYSDVQSSNSEDTVTWSVFEGAEEEHWLDAVLEYAFGRVQRPSRWKLDFWERTPHPDTGLRHSGPEADVILSAAGWYYVIEAKWCQDFGREQGQNHDMTQLQMRSLQASAANVEPGKSGVLVIASGPDRYKHCRARKSIFSQYFIVDGNRYRRNSAAEALGAVAVTWEEIAIVLAENGAKGRAEYLNWRLKMLPATKRVKAIGTSV